MLDTWSRALLETATGELPAPNWQAYLDRAIEEMGVALQTPLTLRAIAPRSELDQQTLYREVTAAASGGSGWSAR